MARGVPTIACCLALVVGACSIDASSDPAPPGDPSRAGTSASAGAGGSGAMGGAANGGSGGAGPGGGGQAATDDAGVDVDVHIYVPPDLTQEMVSAEAVERVFGQAVRFVGFAENFVLYADTVDGSTNLLVYYHPNYDDPDAEPGIRILPETHRHLRFRELHWTSDTYFLACGYEHCAMFERVGHDVAELAFIPGSEFTGGLRYRSLDRLDVRLCVRGPDVPTLCYDRETWTDEAGAPADPEATPGSPPPAGSNPAHPPPPDDPLAGETPTVCPPDSEVTEPLIASRVWRDETLEAATASGRFVFGQWDTVQQIAKTCQYVSAELGPAVDFDLFSCGLAGNPHILTATAAYGSTSCPIGE